MLRKKRKSLEMTVTVTASQGGLKSHLSIDGGVGLNGVMTVSGAKNSALVLMTAALLTNETIELCNVPDLTDIQGMQAILEALGVSVVRSPNSLKLTATQLKSSEPPYELVNCLRASFFSIGSLSAVWATPGCRYPVDAASGPVLLWNTSVDSRPWVPSSMSTMA